MKKQITIAVTVAVVVALFGAYYHVRAQSNERPNSPLPWTGRVGPPVVLASHSLITTYLDQGSAFISGSGFQPVDAAVTVNCQSAAGCTIVAEHWLQFGGASTATNRYAICTQVDGTFQGICPFQGYVPTDGSFVTGSIADVVAVSVGTHTVQEFAFTDATTTISEFSNTYHLYRP
jgi:hypothetical protein